MKPLLVSLAALLLSTWCVGDAAAGQGRLRPLGFGAQGGAPARAKVDVARLGPQVGQRVPDFSLPDQTGRVRTLDSIMGPRGAMLVFLRSADW
jgi:hypothetical protein